MPYCQIRPLRDTLQPLLKTDTTELSMAYKFLAPLILNIPDMGRINGFLQEKTNPMEQ